ncbi:MAG: AgmX/PglI C-terminal domain-containing protein [Myxococcales bacterium]
MRIASLLATLASLASAPAALAAPSLISLPDDHPIVEGLLSKTAIHQVAYIHRDEIQQCYEASLKRRPGLAGRVIAQFVIEATGSVSHVRISESTLNDAAVEDCVVNHLSRWRFPRPVRGRVSVSYPWTLRGAKAANG